MTDSTQSIFTARYQELMRDFPLRPISNNREAEAATAILDRMFGLDHQDPGEAAYVYTLAMLLGDYEDKNEPPMRDASGLDVLKYLVGEHEMRQVDLAKLLDITQAAASLLLSGERGITAEHARRLGTKFGLDPGIFIHKAGRKNSKSAASASNASR